MDAEAKASGAIILISSAENPALTSARILSFILGALSKLLLSIGGLDRKDPVGGPAGSEPATSDTIQIVIYPAENVKYQYFL